MQYLDMEVDFSDDKTWEFLCRADYLKGVFQFETSSAAMVLKKILPTDIKDLALATALNRPGGLKVVDEIANVRNGSVEKKEVNPELDAILKENFGFLVFQEDLMLIAQKLASFDPKASVTLLKALGKKDREKMNSLQEAFTQGMLKNKYSKDLADTLFNQMKAFADYGFNKCIFEEEWVETTNGTVQLKHIRAGDSIKAWDKVLKKEHFVKVLNVYRNVKKCYHLVLQNHQNIIASKDHRFLCEDGEMRTLEFLMENPDIRLITDSAFKYVKIAKFAPYREVPTIDLEVDHPDHNFYCNGIVVSNSHAVSYSQMSFVSAFLKVNYPLEFITSLLNYTQYEQNPSNEIFDCISETKHFKISVLPPSIDKINNRFEIEDGNIRYPIGLVKNVGEALYEKIKTLSPTQTMTIDSFFETILSIKLNSRCVESLIISGALDKFGDRIDILLYYWFLSELQESVLEKFWLFKNGHPFSIELITKFLEHNEVVNPPNADQLDLFNEKKNKLLKPRYKSYFKTEVTRLKNLELFKKNLETIEFYKSKRGLCYFFWENYALGYPLHLSAIEDNTCLFRNIPLLNGGDTATYYGFITEAKHRVSKKDNPYCHFFVKFDKTADFFIFSNEYEGARDILKDDAFVSFEVIKEKDRLKVKSVFDKNKLCAQFEFYKKRQKDEQ